MKQRVSQGRVLVTGASRGIGRAIARALFSRGAQVAIVGRDRDTLVALARESKRRVPVLVGDLSKADECDALIAAADKALDGLDGLICSAGVVAYEPVGRMTREAMTLQMAVNFAAPTFLAQAAAHILARNEHGGAIVNIASTLGVRPAPSTALYAASKAALISMTKSLAVELAPHQIRVNAVAPGVVDTDMVKVARDRREGESEADAITRRMRELAALHPLGRVGEPAEIASATLHLLDAPFTTGAVLHVDGGLLAG